MNKFLVVYNCCGIHKSNTSMWIEHIESILKQKNCNFDVVVSACMIDYNSQMQLLNKFSKVEFENQIFFNFINELHPINVTFNHSIILCSSFQDYRGFLFVSSDIKFTRVDDFERMFLFHENYDVGISNFIVDNENWIPTHIGTDFWNQLSLKHADFPFGSSINCDCMLFDKEIFKLYGKVIPDIFRSWCTESVFPFLCASINKVHKCHDQSIVVHHAINLREGSSTIARSGCEKGCDDLYKSRINVFERLLTSEAFECGFGYAESHFNTHTWTREHLNKIYLVHNSDAYITDYRPKDTERLVNFIKSAVFLEKEELNYSKIKFQFLNFN
jgi:hypothetical protein